MKKFLNTLYVTTDYSYLRRERETVVVEVEKKKALQLPIHTIGNIYCFGHIMVSPSLMQLCSENSIGIVFFTWYGKYIARVHGSQKGNVLLRREQYRIADNDNCCKKIASAIIGAKIVSERISIQRLLRNNPDKKENAVFNKVLTRQKRLINEVSNASTSEIIRGYEGESAKLYFSIFDEMILSNKDVFHFSNRNRRPPLDASNALLSFIYTLIVQDCTSACEGIGLDPSVGFLHKERPGRPSLALDIAEEFRRFIGDRLVLSMINLKQLGKNDFDFTESGAVFLKKDSRKKVLSQYQERKKSEIKHPFLGEALPLGLFFHIQAHLLSRHIRGDLEYYPPFIWR